MNSETQSINAEHWMSDKIPSIGKRIKALAKVLLPSHEKHTLNSTVAAQPKTEPTKDNFVPIDVYKVWYVIHYDRRGSERTTKIYMKKIDSSITKVHNINEVNIEVPLSPLQDSN